MAVCILIAGRSLSRREGYSFALVIACIECLFIPFGTILGVFTIVVLSRESVKASFERVHRTALVQRLGTAVLEFPAQRALRSARYGTLSECQLSYRTPPAVSDGYLL